MKNNKIISLTLILSLFLISCNEFLDELPDNRTELDSKSKIQKILVSAYPKTSYALLTELSSDNIDDYGEKNPYGGRMFEQMAYWKNVTESDSDDPKEVWENCYKAIAHSNQALEAIKALNIKDVSAEKGEALITRAYAHFILVNVFSLHFNKKTSNTDLGIPYLEAPETTLNPQYKRGNVAEVYEKINRDIEEALPLIDDNIYDVPAYHFTKKAAYAFAARFNLFYENWSKANEYATLALGIGDITSSLRNWKSLGSLPRKRKIVTNSFIQDNSNLLTQAYSSDLGVIFGAFYSGSRFNHTRRIADQQTLFARTPWSPNGSSNAIRSSFNFRAFVYTATNLDKTLFYKIPYLFEYTDPVAKIGYTKSVLVPFTTDETLLVRAEAKTMLGQYESALNDINTWSKNFYKNKVTTLSEVNTFYSSMSYSSEDKVTQKKKLTPKFSLEAGSQENMIHYILQCRRILLLHEGMRWFDIKRYGIEVTRYQKIGKDPSNKDTYKVNGKLTKDDPRKAIQIPQDVVTAGLKANPR